MRISGASILLKYSCLSSVVSIMFYYMPLLNDTALRKHYRHMNDIKKIKNEGHDSR